MKTKENFKFAGLVPELYCISISESLDFYVNKLGFHICYERPENQFAFLAREEAQIMLQELRPERSWVIKDTSYPFGRGVNFEIGVSNIDALFADVQAAEIPIFEPIKESWYKAGKILTGCREFLIQDPSGYLLRFSQRIGAKPTE